MDSLHCYFALGIDSIAFALCLRDYYRYKNTARAIRDSVNLELDVLDKDNDSKKYCAIRGTIRPIGVSLNSAMIPNVTGVFQRLKMNEHSVARAFGGYWTEHSKTIHVSHNSVPFMLTNKTVEVEIIEALSAEIIDMDLIYDNYEPAKLGIFDHIFGFFSGVRQKGVQTTEHILRDGSFMTAIGELESDGKTWRLSTSDVGPMIITTATKSTIIKRFEDLKNASMLKVIVCGSIAVVILAIMARKFYTKKISEYHDRKIKEQLENNRKLRRAQMRSPGDPNADHKCVVCLSNPKEIIVIPCGHVCLCEDCATKINDLCPVCRQSIEQKMVAFL